MDRYILIIAGVAIVTAVTLIAAFGSTLSSGTFDAKTAFVSLITADNLDEAEKTYFDESGKLKQEYLQEINKNTDKVPEMLFDLFGSDRINIHVIRASGEEKQYSAITKNRKLVEFRKGLLEDAEIRVEVKEELIEKIFQSQRPVEAFLNAFESGEIKYEGITQAGKIKETTVNVTTSIMSIAQKVYSFFAGIFG